MLIRITIGFTVLTLVIALCLIVFLRRWSKHCTKRFEIVPRSFTAPRQENLPLTCDCLWIPDDFGFLRKQGYWLTGVSCEKFHAVSGKWPLYCRQKLFLPPCACQYDPGDGPYSYPHWERGTGCKGFYLTNGRWPEYCRGPR